MNRIPYSFIQLNGIFLEVMCFKKLWFAKYFTRKFNLIILINQLFLKL